jgi:GntR family transcriptional regulator, transcriptional repressor for pyruvate dehydrogenase complex
VPFQKIATKRKSVQVAEQITEAIRRNVYSTGDRLPAERVIAEQMGVSRPSVREALSALQIAGVLESRAGDGTYVVSRADRQDAGILLLEEEESPVEALEARRVIERAIAQEAAARVTAHTLHRLAATVAALRDAAGARDYEAFGTANGDFHLTIIRAAGNELLERTVRPLIDVMQRQLGREMRRREYLDGRYFDTIYAAHEQIYDALKARDAHRAAEAMDHHFDLIEASLRA